MENIINDNSNELLLQIIYKMSMEIKDLNEQQQLKIKTIIENVLYKYKIIKKDTIETKSDIEEKIEIFLMKRKLEGMSQSTMKNYNYNLNKLKNYFNKPINSITTMDIMVFINHECLTKSPSSINTFMTPIKTFFTWLLNEQLISKNPCANIKPMKEPKRIKNPLNEEEIELLRDKITNIRDKAIFEFFISTGCRVSEVSNVKISDIDFKNKTLLIIGKGNKQRRVYFTERCKRAILNYLNSRKDNVDYLFVSERAPHSKMNSRAFQIIVNKMKLQSGLTRNLSPHIFRHTFATMSFKSGMRPEIIQTILGHEHISTTQIYTKIDQSDVEYSYRRLIA